MPWPGYVKPQNFLIDAGVLYVGNVAVGFGATDGGLSFDPATEWLHVGFDGEFYKVAGLDRKGGGDPRIAGVMIDHSAAALQRYEPGSSSTSDVSGYEITPKKAGVLLVDADYLQNVRWIGRKKGSLETAEVVFPWALITKYKPVSKHKDTWKFDVEIEPRLGPSETDFEKAPYFWRDLVA